MAPTFFIDKTSIDYEYVTISDSKTESVIITNTSLVETDLIISNVSTDNDKFRETVTSFTLKKDEALNIPVVFIPEDTSTQIGKLTIETNAGNAEVNLAGIGLAAPNIGISIDSLYFGKVGLSSSVIKKFTIYNYGTVTLNVSQILSDDLKFVSNKNFAIISSSDNSEVSIEYTPTNPQVDLGILTILSDDPDSPSLTVDLSGEGISPEIVVDDLDFLKVGINTTKEEILTISNGGDVQLEISNITINDLRFSISETFPIIIGTSSSTNITVSFTPDVIGAISGIMTISSNDFDNSNKEIELRGEGVSPEININPSFLDFGDVKISTSLQSDVLISNLGQSELVISQINISNPHFSTVVTSLSVQPSQTEVLAITFSPLDLFLQTGIVTLVNNDLDESNIVINVSGIGAQPSIVVDTNDIDFSDVALNNTKEHILDVSNNGAVDLEITMGAGPTPVFSISPVSLIIGSNETKQLTVSFTPNAYNSFNGTLTVNTNDPNNLSIGINLLGNGVQIPSANTSTTSLDFGEVSTSDSRTKVFTLGNTGVADLEYSISISTNPVYTASPSSGTVIPGNSQTVSVVFDPSSSGSYSATLVITTNDPNNPTITISLSGSTIVGTLSWQQLDLEDLVPDPIKEAAQKIADFAQVLTGVLNVLQTILDAIKAFIISTEDPLKVLIELIKTLVDNLISDLKASGLYFLQIFPGDARIDPIRTPQYFRDSKIDLTNPDLPDSIVNKYQEQIDAGDTEVTPDDEDKKLIYGVTSDPLSSIKGGSAAFTSKILYSFDDPGDGGRPQFSETSKAGAIAIAADSGDIGNILESVKRISNIFKMEFQAQYNPPTNITAIGGDSNVRLTYSPNDGLLPNAYLIFRSEVAGGELKYEEPFIDFKVYWKDIQGRFVTRYELKYVVTLEEQLADIFNVTKDEADSMLRNAGYYIRGLLTNIQQLFAMKFITEDTEDVENGKTYFYVISAATIRDPNSPDSLDNAKSFVKANLDYSDQLIRVDKNGSWDGPLTSQESGVLVFSPFSSEVSASPSSAFGSVEGSLARCRNYRCDFRSSEKQVSSVTAAEENKTIERDLRFVPIRSSMEIQLKRLITTLGRSRYTYVDIPSKDYVLNGKKITFTRTNFFKTNDEITIEYDYEKELKTIEVTNKYQKVTGSGGDANVVIFNLNKSPIDGSSITNDSIFDISPSHIYIPSGTSVSVLDAGDGKIKITFFSMTGPLINTTINFSVTYSYYPEYKNSENFRCINPEFFKFYFDFVKCDDGTTLCPGYDDANCFYNDGSTRSLTKTMTTGCSNLGTSMRRITTFENGQRVTLPENILYATFWDAFYCQNGIMAQRCDGYSKTDPRAGYKGVPPDWINYTVIDLFPFLNNILKIMEKILESLLGGTEKITDSILSFIDLIQKKIDRLRLFIDRIQNVLSIIDQDFSGPGFFILKIPYDVGGNDYLKESIQKAQNGPDSDAFGYTAGVVMVYGGPSAEAIEKALDILF